MILLALALAPIAFILLYVYLRDEYDKEPLKHLIIAFIGGVVIAFPVVLIGNGLSEWWGLDGSSPSIIKVIVYTFVIVACTEEGMKYLVTRWYCYRLPEFDESYDGIMYAVTVSMGFAAIENVLYVSQGGASVGWLRAFSAVPAHAIFGTAMGYFAGKAKFNPIISPWFTRMIGLFLAIILHGAYDFFLFQQSYEYLALASFVMVLIGVFLSFRAMRKHKETAIKRWQE
ncbi:MAG: PrsW family glutamic-type intramembrane protease [Bacteroidia bacterium]